LRTLIAAPATAPGSPIQLIVGSFANSVTLTWGTPTNGDPPTAYIVEAGSGPGLANLANFSTGSTRTFFEASGVGNGTYYVRIRAVNAFGTSAASNEAVLIVGVAPGAPPAAPRGLTNTVNAGGTVSFEWQAPSGAPTSYLIEAGSRSGLADLANIDLGSRATTMTATGVGAGTYFVRVRARNAFGTSAPSNEIAVTVGALACNPNLNATGMDITGAYVATMPLGPSAGRIITIVGLARIPGSDVFFGGRYSDSAGLTGFVYNGALGRAVEIGFVPDPSSGVTVDGAVFTGALTKCSGNKVLEFAGDIHLGYFGTLACGPEETCFGSGVHVRGPGYPMTLTQR
jgi:hypothetical protein